MKETMNGAGNGVELDLQKLLLAYLRKWWLIALCAVLAAAAAFGYTKLFVTPLYRANVTIYVNSIRNSEQIDYLSSSNLAASQQLVNTYSNIIKSNTVLTQVVEISGLTATAEQVRGMLTTEQVDETEMFRVYITHTEPEMAAAIANAVAAVAPEEIEEIVEGSSAKVIDYATVPQYRYSPSFRKNTFMGAAVGIVVAVGFITLMHLLDVRIKDDEDLMQLFDYPILGQIPLFDQVENGKKRNGYGYGKTGYETQKPAQASEEEGGDLQ